MDEEIDRMLDEGCPHVEPPKRRYVILTTPTRVYDVASELADEDYTAQNEEAEPHE